MDCNEVKRKLSEYIDGSLSAGDAEPIREHLEDCDGCSEAFRSMSRVISFMKGMDRAAAPPDFLSRLNARLEDEKPFFPFLRRLFYPLHVKLPLELAAVAAALVLLYYFAAPRGPGAPYSVDLALSEISTYEKIASDVLPAAPKGGKGGDRRTKKGPPDLMELLRGRGARIVDSGPASDDRQLIYLLVEVHPDSLGPMLRDLSGTGELTEQGSKNRAVSGNMLRFKILIHTNSR